MVEKFDILEDIATRTNGDIYLGVVGPVRIYKEVYGAFSAARHYGSGGTGAGCG